MKIKSWQSEISGSQQAFAFCYKNCRFTRVVSDFGLVFAMFLTIRDSCYWQWWGREEADKVGCDKFF